LQNKFFILPKTNNIKKLISIPFVLCILFSSAQVPESWLDNFIFSDKPYQELVEEIDSILATQQPANSQGQSGNQPLDSFSKKYGRWQHFWKTRVDSEGSAKTLNDELYKLFSDDTELCTSSRTNFVQWECLGPFNSSGSGDLGANGFSPSPQHNQGRVESIAVNPFDSRDIILGTKNGGYFITQDDDAAWHNTTNDEGISMFGARDVEYHPGIENLVFAATGNENNYGIGIIKSLDGGESWQNTGLTFDVSQILNDAETRKGIYDIEIDPRSNSNRTVAYAFQYSQGGASLLRLAGAIDDSWEEILNIPLYQGGNPDDAKNIQIEISKGNPDEIWVWTLQGLMRCTVGFNDNSANTIVDGPFTYSNLPSGLSISANANPGATSSTYAGEVFSLWTGKIVTATGTQSRSILAEFDHTNLQWNYLFDHTPQLGKRQNFAVNPFDSDIMYADSGNLLCHSANRGQDFILYDLTTEQQDVHDDIRCLEIIETPTPTDPEKYFIYAGTDGGIVRKEDVGTMWSSINWGGLNIGQYYGLDVAEFEEDYILSGAQDNSINLYRNQEWYETPPGLVDNFNCIIDQTNSNIVYQQGNYRFSRMTLQNINQNPTIQGLSGSTPSAELTINNNDNGYFALIAFEFDLDREDNTRIISGWYNVYESLDQGVNWTQINNLTDQNENDPVTALRIAPSNPDFIYYSRSGDNYPHNNNITSLNGGIFRLQKIGQVYLETDISNNLRDIQDIDNSPNIHAGISDIAVDPNNHERIWISFANFKEDAKVWKTENGGITWENADMEGSLPNFPVNAIEYQEGSNDRLYIGTDIGVFYKDNSMSCWEYYGEQTGFRVTDIAINHCNQQLYVTTWGSSIWKAPLLVDDNKSYIEITQDETWDENRVVRGNIKVKTGVTLNIVGASTEIYMPKNGEIVVEPGARLNITDATITNQCGEMWHKIEVQGTKEFWHPQVSAIENNTYPSTDINLAQYQQGVVVLNKATLSHARNAISLGTFDGDQFIGGGGIVLAEESNFIDNRRSAEFLLYKFSNISRFEDCSFITTDEYRAPSREPHHISMWATHDVRIVNCSFENQSSIEIDRSEAGTGIYTIDASYIARAFCDSEDPLTGECNGATTEPSRFVNLNKGIYSTGTGEMRGSLQINTNEFDNVKWGVTLRSTSGAMVVRNTFTSPHISMQNEGQNQPGFGIYLEGLLGFACTDNELSNMWSGILTNSCGILPNELYRNEIDNMFYYGSTGFGYANYLFHTGHHLQFACNKFSNNGLIGDIAVTGEIDVQGTSLIPARNTFVNTNAYTGMAEGWVALNNTTDPNLFIPYHIPDNPEMDPEYTLGVNKVPNATIGIISFNDYCIPEPLGGILQKREASATDPDGSVLAGLYFEFNQLTTGSNSYEEAEFINQIINAHLNKSEYAQIELLLQGVSTNPWRKLQLAEFQRIQEKFIDAETNLTSLINDGDVLQEAKDVALIYLIKTKLEKTDKTWFDISSQDLATISSFALQEGELPASLLARNILELIHGIHVDVRIDKFDFQNSNPIDTSSQVEPTFSIYPNPIVGLLNIDYNLPISIPFTVRIFELLKNTQVYEGEMSGSPFTLDVSNWESGFYSIYITDDIGNPLFRSRTHIKNQ